MIEKIFKTPEDALKATDEFYLNQSGFSYTDELVEQSLKSTIRLPAHGKVLDLCCGDGIWSKGMLKLNKRLELYGIDISEGAIQKARQITGADDQHFVVGDAEQELSFPDSYFNLIFARGPGLYNQHQMNRHATIKVIESWHKKLRPEGIFYSIFYSSPLFFGKYTEMDKAKLPYNRCPRKTETIDFSGGKYHHTKESFMAPFLNSRIIKIDDYQFVKNNHILVTSLK